jgi:hypothetical protein
MIHTKYQSIVSTFEANIIVNRTYTRRIQSQIKSFRLSEWGSIVYSRHNLKRLPPPWDDFGNNFFVST